MKKSVFALMLSVCFLLVMMPRIGHADDSTALFLNGKQLNPEVPPRLMKDTTMVPIRIIAEQLGCQVGWDQADKRVTVQKGDLNIQLQIDNAQASIDGEQTKLDMPPVLVEGNTLLPLRFVAEQLGVKVTWDQLTRSVYLFQAEDSAATSDSGSVSSSAAPLTDGNSQANKPAANGGTEAGKGPTAGSTSVPTTSPLPSPTPSPTSVPIGGAQPNGSSGDSGGASGVLPSNPSGLPEISMITVMGDQLSIKANGQLKPSIFTLSDPDRIVIDIPGAVIGKQINGSPAVQNGEILLDHPYIAKVRYAMFSSSPSVARIVIDLKRKIDYNLVESKSPGELLLAFKNAKYKIVIDAGHGGKDSGALSVNGFMEKDFTLSLAAKIAKLLGQEPAIQPYMSRSDDTFVALDDRVAYANNLGAALFVSVHGNKIDNPSITGTETYYNRDESLAFANTIHKQLVAATGFKDRGVRNADFRVIKYTTMPAVLCEVGYLSNPGDEASMYNQEFQNKVAASIVTGIKDYLQIK